METGKLHEKFKSCFQGWITQQHQDLEELLQALAASDRDDENLRLLAGKGIKHFEDYHDSRASLAKHDAPSLLSPTWCSCFENAFLWIGGCRPSISIRLVYSLCGSELDTSHLTTSSSSSSSPSPSSSSNSHHAVVESRGNLADISSNQLVLINSLHLKTIKEEEKLSEKMANLQEEIADDPLAMIAKRASHVGDPSSNLDEVLQCHSLALERVLVEADKLRLSTLKELIRILTPLQTADLLVTTKKLHLSMHEWGKSRDQQMKA